MAKLPIYTQQYGAQGRKADAQDFDGSSDAVGRAMSNLGDSLGQLAVVEGKRKSREDTIERVRAINAYMTAMDQESTRMQAEDDLTSTDAPGAYSQFGQTTLEDVMAKHNGSEHSKAILEEELTKLKGDYTRSMYKTSTAAQYKQVTTYMDNVKKSISAQAEQNPVGLEGIIANADREVDNMAGALPQEAEAAYRQEFRAAALSSAADRYMLTGDYDAAEAILTSDEAVQNMDIGTRQSSLFKVYAGQREAEKGRIEGEQKIVMATEILGREPTAAERARIAGVNAPQGQITFAEKVRNMEAVLGRPLTETEMLKFGGITGDAEALYGNSLRGKSMARVDKNSTAFANGILPPEEDQRFVTDVMEVYGAYQEKDPFTGMMTTKRRPAPPHIIEAMNKRGMGHLLSEDNVEQGPSTQHPDPTIGVSPLTQGESSIWDDIGKVAGPVGAIEGMIESMPFVGGMTEQDVTRAKKRASGLQRNTVTALQNNPKYAEGERKAIEQEIGMLPGVWSNPENAKAVLITIDENLESRQNTAYKTMNDRTLPVDTRQAAANVFNIVQNVRSQFGLPPRVKSREEALKLPPGTEIILPDGSLGVVPESAGMTDGQ